MGQFASWAKAAAMLRTLSADYFIQGPHAAWFYQDVLFKGEWSGRVVKGGAR